MFLSDLNQKVKDNCVLLNDGLIPRAETFTCLRVNCDEKFSWEKHTEKTCGKVSAGNITGPSYDVKSADVFDTLRWETFDARRSRKKSILINKIPNGYTALNLKDLFRKKM